MRSFLARVGEAVVLLLLVVIVNFSLIHVAPGDPASVIMGQSGGGSAEMLQQIREDYGLDRPFIVQLFSYIGKVARGDLGQSFNYGRSVVSLVLDRVGGTILLSLTALSFAIVVGTVLGTLTARRPRSILSSVVSVTSLAGFAAPSFWLGIVLVLQFARNWGWFPLGGMRDIVSPQTGIRGVFEVIHHLVLPAVTLGFVYLAQYARISRASMTEVLQADYVRTARAKGAPERLVVGKHALRNAVIPVVTIAGLQFGSLLSGAVLVETVFNWPGLGRLAFEAILNRDTPVLLGILLSSAVLVVVFNLLTDLSYRLIDPRMRKNR